MIKSPPAPGYRHRDTGALYGIGYYGYSYSSSMNESAGVCLDFALTYLYPSAVANRGFGFQLRCLSE